MSPGSVTSSRNCSQQVQENHNKNAQCLAAPIRWLPSGASPGKRKSPFSLPPSIHQRTVAELELQAGSRRLLGLSGEASRAQCAGDWGSAGRGTCLGQGTQEASEQGQTRGLWRCTGKAGRLRALVFGRWVVAAQRERCQGWHTWERQGLRSSCETVRRPASCSQLGRVPPSQGVSPNPPRSTQGRLGPSARCALSSPARPAGGWERWSRPTTSWQPPGELFGQ